MAPSFMKSFKVLALLTLAATLSCGSPTNVIQATGSTDGFIKVIKRKTQAKDLLGDTYLNAIINAALDASQTNGQEFTKNFVEVMWDNDKNYNYLICRTRTSLAFVFQGVEGVDWARGRLSTMKYDLLIAGSATFTLASEQGGDGNWAWKGSVDKGQDIHGNVVRFENPGSGVIESGGD